MNAKHREIKYKMGQVNKAVIYWKTFQIESLTPISGASDEKNEYAL